MASANESRTGRPVRLSVFGVLEARVGGASVGLGPLKQRIVLGLLLCRPGEETSTGELTGALWDEPAPASAANNLRTYVHGLRRLLGNDLISGNGRPGYRLRADLVEFDLAEFETLCRDGEAALRRDDQQAAHDALTAAVALRRGPAFAGLDQPQAIAAEAARVEERWLLAVEQRAELDLDQGRVGDLTGELATLVDRHPYRERLIGLLMRALYRSGRQTEALTVYRRAAGTLDQELGIEPGPELAELHRAMLRQDLALDRPAEVVTPAEIPTGTAHFTGRTRETAALTAALAEGRRSRTVPLIGVVGPAGVGKTTLVVEWAQQVAPEFPDGQIFVDLRGFSAEPAMPTADALRRLLWSLGVEGNRVPVTTDRASALLRSTLAGKRLLIVLDNALSAAQVEPLLPGGHGNAVVVTSRSRLAGLTARHGLRQVQLDPLNGDDALSLITRILGPERAVAEPVAARELAARCGHLPLALCIAAANIAEDLAGTIEDYLAEYRDDKWVHALRAAGDPDRTVIAAFDLSLRRLSAEQRRLLALLGLVPGPSFTVDGATALAGFPAGNDLVRLADACLVRRTSRTRFAFHDLIREYAKGRAVTLQEPDRTAALTRLYTHYRDVSDAADRVLQPGALRLPLPATAPFTGDRQAAQKWFADERDSIVAACHAAADNGPYDLATRLADAAGGYLWARIDLEAWSAVAEAGARAAKAAEDVQAAAAAEIAMARIADARCDFTAGVSRYETAAELARQARWREGEAVALGSMAALLGEMGNPELAISRLEAARATDREIGARLQEGRALLLMGAYRVDQGELDPAEELFDEAMALIERENSRIGRAIILDNMAELALLRRHFDTAEKYAAEAVLICAEVNHVACEISATVALSAAHRGRGSAAAALPFAQRALAMSTTPDARDLGVALHEMAEVYDALGEPRRAIEYHRAAYRLTADAQTRWLSISCAISLGLAEYRLARAGRRDPDAPPAPDLHRALTGARGCGYRGLEGAALAALAEIGRDDGDAAAADYARRALELQRTSGWRSRPTDLEALV